MGPLRKDHISKNDLISDDHISDTQCTKNMQQVLLFKLTGQTVVRLLLSQDEVHSRDDVRGSVDARQQRPRLLLRRPQRVQHRQRQVCPI